ncbi:DUF4340 domain-containing protein [Dehalococcoidia bacterium]|nr:DUF4340 domain-containing protein [Dehalococcoidia bacterium]
MAETLEMNYRISFILLVMLAVVGGYVFIFELQQEPEKDPLPPWIYDIEFTDIIGVNVTYQGKSQSFIRVDYEWNFKDTGDPVDLDRWSGIPLLLSGPRIDRVLTEQSVNLVEFGLAPPESDISVTIEGGRKLSMSLGHKTPDGASHYALMPGSPTMFLINSSWGDVINRLVIEPPILISTPTPNTGEAG